MTGSKVRRTFLERTDRRVVWAVEYKEEGKNVEGIRVVWLHPPNSWSLDTCGDYRELGEYNLKPKGKNKTRLDMTFRLSFESKDDVEDRKEWEKRLLKDWGIFARFLENDYRTSLLEAK